MTRCLSRSSRSLSVPSLFIRRNPSPVPLVDVTAGTGGLRFTPVVLRYPSYRLNDQIRYSVGRLIPVTTGQ